MPVVSVSENEENVKKGLRYELLPPDGGWGYIVSAVVAVVISCTLQPLVAFGLIFGGFLRDIGDETTGTALTNGFLNTAYCFTGLLSNHLLQKYSYRKVGLIGALIFSVGAIGTVFVQSLVHLIITVGFLEGLGFGLLLPSIYSALDVYFDKKMNLVMSLCQASIILVTIVAPFLAEWSIKTYGFRGTTLLLAGLSLHAFPAILTLQPVKWHMIKKPIFDGAKDLEKNPIKKYVLEEPRLSIGSVGEGFLSLGSARNKTKKPEVAGKLTENSMDLSLFKDPIFLNIAIGLSLAYSSDIAFISVLPLSLSMMGFEVSYIATAMSVFFISDFISRLTISGVSAIVTLRNRYVLLAGTSLSALLRCAFVLSNNYYYNIIIIASLGFLRCLIQTPLPLVIREEYPEKFSSAFSLFMVVCGVVNLILGPLLSFVKSYTGSDEMVIHVLTLELLICVFTWIIELIFRKKSKNTT